MILTFLFISCLVLFLQGCQQATTTYQEFTPNDLVTNEYIAEPVVNKPDNTTSPAVELDPFAPPGVLENLAAKPIESANPITQVSALNANSAAPLTEVIVTQSFPLVPKEIKLLVPEKTFDQVAPENSLRVSYDDIDLLKVLNMDPVPLNAVDYFPDWLKELDGKRVRIRGYMYPTQKNTGITYFSLARDTGICCFGPNGKVYDLFGVKLRKGVTASYMELRPFDVVGVFHIEPDLNHDILENIYYIDDAIIIQ